MKTILFSLLAFMGWASNLTPLSAQPVAPEFRRTVVGEEITATWCGFCPRGFVGIENLKAKYPGTFISIAVHDGDVMAVAAYDNALSQRLPNLPKILVDRRLTGDPYADLEKLYLQALAEPAPAAVALSAAFTDAGRTRFEADLRTRFAENSDGREYAYALVLTEKEVHVDSPAYVQLNYYSGFDQPFGGYELLPPRIPAAQMTYPDVARAIFDDFDGIPGSVPSRFAAGEELFFHYEADLPDNVLQTNNLCLVAMLIDRSTGAVCNAASVSLAAETPTANAPIEAGSRTVDIRFVDGRLRLTPCGFQPSLRVEVYDFSGRPVASFRTRSEGTIMLDGPFPKGIYTVRLSDGRHSYTEKVRNCFEFFVR